MKSPQSISRRGFLVRSAVGAAAAGLGAPAPFAAAASAAGARKPMLMRVGHQHDHSAPTLRTLAAFGVKNICSGHLGREIEKEWTVDALTRLRQHVESFGIALDAVPLPMSSREISKAEMPEILLDKNAERDRALDDICTM